MSVAAAPRQLGRYVALATLGAGAMGEVLRARDERLGRDVAIKTVRNLFGVNADLFRTRFEAEARALAALSHPAIVQVHDLGFEGDEPYLVMELVDGPSLKGVLAERTSLPAGEVRALGIQLARALEAAHARGILHRDIKPANVLLAPTGQWKLADFGVAHVPDSSVTMTGQFLGTPAYSAPEALALGQFSEASDVFGLAALLVEAATGVRMRGNASLSELVQRSSEPVLVPPGLDAGLARSLRQALSIDPASRPSASRLAEILATSGEQAAIAQPAIATAVLTAPGIPSHGAPRAVEPASRKGWLVAAIAGGVVLVGLIAALSRGSGSPSATPAAKPTATPAPDAGRPSRPPIVERPTETRRVEISAPSNLDDKGAKEWSKIDDKLRRRDWYGALDKLDQFERKFGGGPETAQLRAALQQAIAASPARDHDDDRDEQHDE